MNIQRYKVSDMAHLHPDRDGEICMFKDVEQNNTYTSGLEGIIKEQTKEIERLRAGLVECGECVKYTGSYESVTALVKELTK